MQQVIREKHNCYELRGKYTTTVEIEFKTTISILPKNSSTAGHIIHIILAGPFPSKGTLALSLIGKSLKAKQKLSSNATRSSLKRQIEKRTQREAWKAPKGSGTKRKARKQENNDKQVAKRGSSWCREYHPRSKQVGRSDKKWLPSIEDGLFADRVRSRRTLQSTMSNRHLQSRGKEYSQLVKSKTVIAQVVLEEVAVCRLKTIQAHNSRLKKQALLGNLGNDQAIPQASDLGPAISRQGTNQIQTNAAWAA